MREKKYQGTPEKGKKERETTEINYTPTKLDPAVDKNHVGKEQRGRERVEQETSRE